MESILFNERNAVLIALIVAAIISWFSIPVVVRVTMIKRLTDKPGSRKIHKREIPTLGGVALYSGFSFGFLLSVNGYMTGVNYFFLATLLLFLSGMKDDLVTLDPNKKLAAEIISALLLLFFTDIRITSLHGFLGITIIPIWLTYLITIFTMIVIINALNLIDGIDGLAAVTGIISAAALGIWFWLSNETGFAIMAAALIGTLIGFIRFNISDGRYKIFMGDTGSLLVGFVLAAMTITFNEVSDKPTSFHKLVSAPAISIAILIVPLYDTLRVFTIRIFNGRHPFTADNRHIHHMMLRAGFTHKRTDVIIAIFHILIISLSFILDHIGTFKLTVVLLSICLFLTGLIYLRIYYRFFFHNIGVGNEDLSTINTFAKIHSIIARRRIRVAVRSPIYDKKNQNVGIRDTLAHINYQTLRIKSELHSKEKKETNPEV